MTAVEYSQRLGAISDEQLQAALDRFDLGRFVSAEPAEGGLFGQNLMLASTKGEYVLRGSAGLDQQLRPEQFFTNLLHERTDVPVPWPYLIERKKDIFGWSFAIMPRLPGTPPNEPDQGEKATVARAMGETLARTQALTWPQCGEFDADAGSILPIESTYADWTIARVRDLLAQSLGTIDEDIEWVEGVIASARDALDEPFEPVFTQYDYKENNTVGEWTGDRWRVNGMFDYAGAFFADGEESLMRSIATYARQDIDVARAFAGAYRDAWALRPGFAERFPLYMLAERLIIWEFGHRNKMWFTGEETLREWAGCYAELDVVS
jgi:hygromycin-B 7''-O-kinase